MVGMSAPTASLARASRRGVPLGPQLQPKPPTVAGPDDFATTARRNHLAGSFTDPATGAHYSTGAGDPGGGGSGGADGGLDLSAITSYLDRPAAGGAPAPAAVPDVAPIDTTAAHAAAFARSKDQVGQVGASALRSLRAAAGGRNMLGAGMEGRQTASVINAGQAQLGEVSRDAAVDDARRADDTAKFNYSGAAAQRAQTMSDATARRGQDIADRGSRVNQLQGITSLLRASRRPVAY